MASLIKNSHELSSPAAGILGINGIKATITIMMIVKATSRYLGSIEKKTQIALFCLFIEKLADIMFLPKRRY
jgi:ABC-type uncharacterized transport system ATPase subunit